MTRNRHVATLFQIGVKTSSGHIYDSQIANSLVAEIGEDASTHPNGRRIPIYLYSELNKIRQETPLFPAELPQGPVLGEIYEAKIVNGILMVAFATIKTPNGRAVERALKLPDIRFEMIPGGVGTPDHNGVLKNYVLHCALLDLDLPKPATKKKKAVPNRQPEKKSKKAPIGLAPPPAFSLSP